LESHGWWSGPITGKPRFVHEWPLATHRAGLRPRPVRFYFLSLVTIGLAGVSLIDLPWPPLSATRLTLSESSALALLLLFGLSSALLSLKALLKLLFQVVLTGTFYGVKIRLLPWGLSLRNIDEHVFLSTTRMFLCLKHLG